MALLKICPNPKQDLTGRKMGNLKVIEYVNISSSKKRSKWRWKCKCACGKIIYVRTSILNGVEANQKNCKECQAKINLKQNRGEKSSNFQDLTGKIIGELKIIKYINISKDKNIPKWRWRCKCACGKIIYVRTARLNGTEATQKNCKRCQGKINAKTRILPDYGSIKNALFLAYKNSAKRRKFLFKLTFEYFIELILGNCYYCGNEPAIHSSMGQKLNGKSPFKRNGIDRKNNKEGYTVENCVSCCMICNTAKHHYSIKEFAEWLKRIYNYKNPELKKYMDDI